ncbi:metallopeptidase family protein [Sinomonas sp. ASV322]|uniref:metallopeptidase family protein n=1 Tax=Sinomonas sp. ASV322 TaxID=3041920 RepID=UPI0027DDEE90|nr:metallopeptidase family protein [Sinomonas sp. ASV322]MDQ4503696.1 metallopeptidase family protein [Sinomonas sp. ASV322]
MQDRSTPGPAFGNPDSGSSGFGATGSDAGLSIRLVPPAGEPGAGRRRGFRERHRNRHGRGLRGEIMPSILPGSRTRGERFEDWVLDSADRLQEIRGSELDDVEYVVEEIPPGLEKLLREGGRPPQGSFARAAKGRPARVTIYRRVVETEAPTAAEAQDLVHDVVVEYTAALLNVEPETLDPYYRGYR